MPEVTYLPDTNVFFGENKGGLVDATLKPKNVDEMVEERENTSVTCWGCLNAFGKKRLKVNEKITDVYETYLYQVPFDTLALKLSDAYIREFVVTDPDNEDPVIWGVEEVKTHLRMHMHDSRLDDLQNSKRLKIMLEVAANSAVKEAEDGQVVLVPNQTKAYNDLLEAQTKVNARIEASRKP